MKFKEDAIREGMTIHCPKEEDAKVLLDHMRKLGYNVQNMHPRVEWGEEVGNGIFYEIGNNKFWNWGNHWETHFGKEVTEFSDLIYPEPLSGKEVIEWLDKYSREIESMPELFPNCKTITDVVEWYTPECIIEKMVWYEKHKKIESENSTQNSTGGDTSTEMSAVEVLEWLDNHY